MQHDVLQYGVPTTEMDFSVSEMATPKSANFTSPFLVVRILAPYKRERGRMGRATLRTAATRAHIHLRMSVRVQGRLPSLHMPPKHRH